MTAELNVMLITASTEIARYAEASGVQRIFADMETRGKAVRQGHLDTHKSAHTLADVSAISKVLVSAELMVRLNPPWDGTPSEVEDAISAGAQRLMLPLFTSAIEVRQFLYNVAGRVPVTLLVETPQALVRLPAYLSELGRADHVHFGLNDLTLGCGLHFLFEPLAGGLLEAPCALCREAGITFGIGGVGRIGQGEVPADWIVGEHVRLGSTWVILSRAFRGIADTLDELRCSLDLTAELAALHRVEAAFRMGHLSIEDNRKRFVERAFSLAGQRE